MKKIIPILILLLPLFTYSQAPILDSWIMNNNGAFASYYENTGTAGSPNFVFHPTTDSADILTVCYTADSVWTRSKGMTANMGTYLNPGQCIAQNYTFKFPRTPTVETTKTISPKVGNIGLLINGIPIYGLGNSYSWDGSANVQMGGMGIWNVEVHMSEGHVLDTAFSGHPQQNGAYHTHAKPWRLFGYYPITQHSPLVGYAFDGHPVYGPYGYSDPMNASSAVTRMKSGYSLRVMTNRQTLPYGVTLMPSQYGPPVNTTYPLGSYCEDYEWLASNGGDLDKYNGRFCLTPEYPAGTYAYFTTIDAAGMPEFPYYIGIEYYGKPVQSNLGQLPTNTIPSTGVNCVATGIESPAVKMFSVFPNPAAEAAIVEFGILSEGSTIRIFDAMGRQILSTPAASGRLTLHGLDSGLYFIQLVNASNKILQAEKLVVIR